jgi:hypothetical protein
MFYEVKHASLFQRKKKKFKSSGLDFELNPALSTTASYRRTSRACGGPFLFSHFRQGPTLKNFLRPQVTNKLARLSLASLSGLVLCLQVWPEPT